MTVEQKERYTMLDSKEQVVYDEITALLPVPLPELEDYLFELEDKVNELQEDFDNEQQRADELCDERDRLLEEVEVESKRADEMLEELNTLLEEIKELRATKENGL